MEAYIKIKNISKKINKNKIYGFRGINGSGKTMLFRAICGLISLSSGEIIIDGKKLHDEISFPQSVGALIENPGFLPNYSGKENLKFIANINEIIKNEDIDKVLTLVGLDHKDNRKFKEYSLGMKQKLGIAQALMENPDLIILDEPTNALDEESVKNILNIIYILISFILSIYIFKIDNNIKVINNNIYICIFYLLLYILLNLIEYTT